MNRLVSRAEIFALLCTESFGFVTGQVLGIDGGRSISCIAFGRSGFQAEKSGCIDAYRTFRYNGAMSPEQAEAAVISLFATIYPATVDEMARIDAAKGLERARSAFLRAMIDGWKREYEKLPDRTLATYVRWLTSIVTAGTRWEIVEQTARSVRFRFTACPWATHFRAVGRPDVGRFFCDADYPMVECFSNSLGFERSQTLMDGDPYCDHHFFLER